MKNLLLGFLFILGIGISSQAQTTSDFQLGIHGGIPVGDAGDVSDFNAGFDAAYLFGVVDMVEVGPLVGYSHYFIEDFDDISFLPIAASGRVAMGAAFAGLDLGYAVGLSDGNDGGFYYRPKIGFGFYGLNLVGSYSGISVDGTNISSVNLGLEFNL
jgi:hypothetical protein